MEQQDEVSALLQDVALCTTSLKISPPSPLSQLPLCPFLLLNFLCTPLCSPTSHCILISPEPHPAHLPIAPCPAPQFPLHPILQIPSYTLLLPSFPCMPSCSQTSLPPSRPAPQPPLHLCCSVPLHCPHAVLLPSPEPRLTLGCSTGTAGVGTKPMRDSGMDLNPPT